MTTIGDLIDAGTAAALDALFGYRPPTPGEQDGTMPTTAPALARCTERACPVRFASGADRPCRDHQASGDVNDVATRMAELGLMAAPGDRGDQHDGAHAR